MALIGRIRKNMWLVFIVIGLALAGFVVMDMMTAAQQGGVAGATTIGEVNGVPVDYRDFNSAETALYAGAGDVYGAKEATWNYMVDRTIVNSEAEANGFNVPTPELVSQLFGSNPAPAVRQMFTNPTTGQLDRQQLLQVQQTIQSGQAIDPNFENRWRAIENQVSASILQQKLGNAVAKGMYTPTWMVEMQEETNKMDVSFAVVRVPFDVVEEEIAVSEDDVKSFIKGKENRYESDDETRMIKYAVMNVYPTAADSAMRKEEITNLIPEFRTTDDDSLFAFNNDGFFTPYYNQVDDLPEPTRDIVSGMEEGEVFGPYLENNNFFAMKLIDKKSVADSVTSRHILRSTNLAAGGSSLEDARAYIDSLKNLLDRGIAEFDSLAIQNSQDPGSSFSGGDLGTLTQGAILPELNEVLFHGSREGGMYVVETPLGVHLVEVQDIVFNNRDDDYKVAFIRNPVTPSDDTQLRLEGEMTDLITSNRELSALEAAVEGRTDISFETAGPFMVNDYFISGLGSDQTSRDIIKWIFDKNVKVGSVSPELYSYSDPVNYFDSKYVIAGLAEINEPGMPPASALMTQLENEIIKEKRGEMIASQISGKDLSALASEYEVSVDTMTNITFTSTTLRGMGAEPEVIAKAYGMAEGAVSEPIVGNNGVYVVKVITKQPASGSSNIPLVRNIMTNTARAQAAEKIMQALREKADISDSRSRFF